MSIGRIFPIMNPNRLFPQDPLVHGDNDRDAPLPFQLGVGSSSDIEMIFEISPLLQILVTAILDPDDPWGPGGGGVGGVVICNPITNQKCVPTGTITRSVVPTATLRCAIT